VRRRRNCAASPQLSDRNPRASSSRASTARYPGRSPSATARSNGSSPYTTTNTLSTAAVGPTARSMWCPTAASSAYSARIGRTVASSTGSADQISSRRGSTRASARPLHVGTQCTTHRREARRRPVVIVVRVRASATLAPVAQPAPGDVGEEGAVVGAAVEAVCLSREMKMEVRREITKRFFFVTSGNCG
jgi:hypothetical protein